MTEPARINRDNAAGDVVLADAPVCAVLVMEDRAQITRRAELTLPAGRCALRVEAVTPLVADRTLRCRLRPQTPPADPDNAARVLDTTVRRRYLVRPARPEREQEIRGALDDLVAEYLSAYDRFVGLLGERGAVAQALTGFRQQLLDRLVVGPFEPAWGAQVDRAFERRAAIESDLLRDQWEQQDRQARLARLVEELRLALAPVSEYGASLGAELWLPEAGRFSLEFEYQVPCALWRPSYRAELLAAEGGQRVRWVSAGTVWQLSGEDWRSIELSFSTARPALGAELPLLEEDRLGARSKTERERQVVEVASRDQVIAKTSDAKLIQSDTPPGLDDGGEARTYRVPERVDVPSDGQPHRIEFDSWEQAARCEWVCLPERAEFVFLRSEQTNPTALPLLTGPVQLVRDGALVGRGQIRLVTAGEAFSLSWGSEDGLVVLREVDREFEETSIRKRRLHGFAVEVYLANHTGAAQALKLFERIPLPEIEKVEVEIDPKKTTAGFSKDDQALLCWDVRLAAGEEKRIELAYRVSMPSNVIWNG